MNQQHPDTGVAEDKPATLNATGLKSSYHQGDILAVTLSLEIHDICLFDPVLRLFIRQTGTRHHLVGADSHQGDLFYPWLPRGSYQFSYQWPVSLPAGDFELCIAWGSTDMVRPPDLIMPINIGGKTESDDPLLGTWSVSPPTRKVIDKLSWQQGMNNWFHRHFCHAAVIIGESFLHNSPLLKGRILDIGAGEGITDLGLLLRYQPEELVAMDIVDYIQELPKVARENDLPLDSLPAGFTFLQASCESIPYADHSFDVVISWGSVEHIKGGYQKVLDEVWRVLKPGGLFFVNPGLYYSEYGSHLGEFTEVPHLHLKLAEEELKDLVMTTSPRIMDRSGFDVTNENYWRFYKDLNLIRVAEFEDELKAYGYEFVRAAIRANDQVEYTSELQEYSIVDLAIEDVFFALRKPAG